jgi:hypothetical protein
MQRETRVHGASPNGDRKLRRRAWIEVHQKHKKKDCWPDILASAGLDDIRLARDLSRLLAAKKTEFYQGTAVADVTDNAVRMRAVELLAELLGRKKAEIALITELPQVIMQFPDELRDAGDDHE